jgi:hypothetical protein
MSTTRSETRAPEVAPPTEGGLRLEDLTTMRFDDLAALYAAGEAPALEALEGSPEGRMLTLRGPGGRGPLRGLVARIASSGRFPWGGKDFFPGGGINRIRLGGDRRWYPFQTRLEPSVLDGRPCVALDYDQPGNPGLIRRVRDELRQVGPGLLLGPALLGVAGRQVPVLWFAVRADPARA